MCSTAASLSANMRPAGGIGKDLVSGMAGRTSCTAGMNDDMLTGGDDKDTL